MPFDGEIEGLMVSLRSLEQSEIREELLRTRPRE